MVTTQKSRALGVLIAAGLTGGLLLAPAAVAADVTVEFVNPRNGAELARDTPVPVQLKVTNTTGAPVANVAVRLSAESENASASVQSLSCSAGGMGTSPTTGSGVCSFPTLAANASATLDAIVVTTATRAQDYVYLGGTVTENGVAAGDADDYFRIARLPLPKADLNVQVQGPAQLAVGETGELKTTLNNVGGDAADGVTSVPRFSMGWISTREVDVLGVTATAGLCKLEPITDYDDVTGLEVLVPNYVRAACEGGALPAGGSITATVTVKAKAPGSLQATPSFSVSNFEDVTPISWWAEPEFRVAIFQPPVQPPFVDPTPTDQAELVAPAGGVLKVSKKGVATVSVTCRAAAGCPQAVVLYKGGKGKSKLSGQLKVRALKNGQTTKIKLKLNKKQLAALKKTKKKGVQVTFTGAELALTATLVAGK